MNPVPIFRVGKGVVRWREYDVGLFSAGQLIQKAARSMGYSTVVLRQNLSLQGGVRARANIAAHPLSAGKMGLHIIQGSMKKTANGLLRSRL